MATTCQVSREARELLGNSLPMVATYDFHAISSRWENEEGAVPFPHDTNPHIDAYEQGLEAARCLVKMLDGSWAPVTRRLFVPIVGPNIGQSTWSQIPEQEEELLGEPPALVGGTSDESDSEVAPSWAGSYIRVLVTDCPYRREAIIVRGG